MCLNLDLNMEQNEVDLTAQKFGCRRGLWPNTYLSLPLNGITLDPHPIEPLLLKKLKGDFTQGTTLRYPSAAVTHSSKQHYLTFPYITCPSSK